MHMYIYMQFLSEFKFNSYKIEKIQSLYGITDDLKWPEQKDKATGIAVLYS